MKEIKFFVLSFFILLSSCDPNLESNANKVSDEFLRSSTLCHGLDVDKCLANDLCDWAVGSCLPNLPIKYALHPLNLDQLNKELVGRTITAMANGPVQKIYIGTDNGLLIWSAPHVEKIQDFSDGDATLAGLSYVRAIASSPLNYFAFAAIGKNGDARDPDAKIIYEISQKSTVSGLNISHIFEPTPGFMVFGGVDTTWVSSLSTNKFTRVKQLAGVTSGVFNPNGSTTWVGTGGADPTKHVGIRRYSGNFRYISANEADRGTSPTLWGSSVASPNADISSMVLVEPYILVGLRAHKGNPNSGGIVVFDIYRPDSVLSGKPFLAGLDVRNIVVGNFDHGDKVNGIKKRVIMLATDKGLFDVKLKRDRGYETLSITTTAVDRDNQGNSISLKEIDNLFQRDSRSFWFSHNNKLFMLTVD